MAQFESDAIILRTYDLCDADRIVVMLTADHGIVRAVAKGSKRSKSRFGSSLEFLSLTKVAYFIKESQELAKLNVTDLQRSSFRLVSDPSTLMDLSHLVEVLLRMTPEHEPNEKLFRMMRAVLDVVSDDISTVPGIRPYFKIWLLKLAGYLPDVNRCNSCGAPLTGESDSDISAASKILCIRCCQSIDQVRSAALKQVRLLLKLHPSRFCRSGSDQRANSFAAIERIADKLLMAVSERPLGAKAQNGNEL